MNFIPSAKDYVNAMHSFNRSMGVFSKTLSYLKKSYSPEANMQELKMLWALHILDHLNVEVQVKGEIKNHKGMLFVGNHISYLDIPILFSLVPDLSFVSKKEIRSWPIIGHAAKKIDTIFVHREKKVSREIVREAIRTNLCLHKKKIAVFPSGTTSLDENKIWKKGIFEIAAETGVYVQPFRLKYEPLRDVAYIDDDMFFSHLMNLSRLKIVTAVIEFHEPVQIQSPELEALRWQNWSRSF